MASGPAFPEKLSATEFSDALDKGLGRAILHVREHKDTGVESEILRACLHQLKHDSTEDDREVWTCELIDHSGRPNFYYEALFSQFMETTPGRDLFHQCSILALLAKRGHPEARDLLYRKFDRQEFDESYPLGSYLIDMDGIPALLHIAKVIGLRIKQEPSYKEDCLLIEISCEPYGKEKAARALEEAAKDDSDIKAYIDNLISNCGQLYEKEPRAPPRHTKTSLAEFLKEVSSEPSRKLRGKARSFGRQATPAELKELHALLLAETDLQKGQFLLLAFSWAEMPDIPERLLPLLESKDWELKNAAVSAFAFQKHPKVREWALKLLNKGDFGGLELLLKNYHPGDGSIILKSIEAKTFDFSTDEGRQEVHFCARDIEKIYECHPLAELHPALLWAYENQPCAFCREFTVKRLIEANILSAELAQECLFDANLDTRALVAELQNFNATGKQSAAAFPASSPSGHCRTIRPRAARR